MAPAAAKATTTARIVTAGAPDSPPPNPAAARRLLAGAGITTPTSDPLPKAARGEASGTLRGSTRGTETKMLGVVNGLVQQAGNMIVEERVHRRPTDALSGNQTECPQ